jgi:hypothetical protein
MYGETMMDTRREVTYGSEHKLDIVISVGTGEHDIEEPIQFDPERLVLSLPMLIMLIYTVSLHTLSSVKLNIHNQCLNADLLSPTYVTGDELECHRPPDHKVCTCNTMRSAFIIKLDAKSYGALIYRLRRKQSHESTGTVKDTSSVACLLIVWEISGSKELCADVLLVKHRKGFEWNKDNIGKLCSENSGKFRTFYDSATETWSLDDNVALMATFEIMNENHILNITISEVERDYCAKTPVHINLKR